MSPNPAQKRTRRKMEFNNEELSKDLSELKTMVRQMSVLLEGSMGADGLIAKHSDLSERHFQLERKVLTRFLELEKELVKQLNEKADHKDFKAIEAKVNRWGGVISAAVILMPVIVHFLS